MYKIANTLIDYAVKKHSPKFVGNPTNQPMFDFEFKQPALPKIEKSDFVTISPIK